MIRLRRPDGTYELVEETPSILSDRREREDQARTRFEAGRLALEEAVLAKEKAEGPTAGLQLLLSFLRSPGPDLAEQGKVYRTIELLSTRLLELANPKEARAGEQAFFPAVSASLRSLLRDTSIDPEVRLLAAASIGGLPRQFLLDGETGRLVDGVWTYDPSESYRMYVAVNLPDNTVLKSKGNLSELFEADPLLLRTLQGVAADPGVSAELRASALLTLAPQALGPDHEELVRLARNGDVDLARAAILSLTVNPDPVSASEFFSILTGAENPLVITLLLGRLADGPLRDPRVEANLNEVLFAPTPQNGMTFPDFLIRRAVLETTVDVYSRTGDERLCSILSADLGRLAGQIWRSTSPVAVIAERAAERGAKALVPSLEAALAFLPSPEDQVAVKRAILKLGR
jgi:hypothetical protein